MKKDLRQLTNEQLVLELRHVQFILKQTAWGGKGYLRALKHELNQLQKEQQRRLDGESTV